MKSYKIILIVILIFFATISVCGQTKETQYLIKKLIVDNHFDPLHPKPFHEKCDSIYKLCEKLKYDEGKLLCLEKKIKEDLYIGYYNKVDYIKAIELAKKLNNYELLINIITSESFEKSNLGLYDEVERDLKGAMFLIKKLDKDKRSISRRRIYTSLANLYNVKKAPFEITEYYSFLALSEALLLKEGKYRTKTIFQETVNLAELYAFNNKKYKAAMQFITKADSINNILKYEYVDLVQLNNIKGIYYYKMKNYDESIKYLNRSIQYCKDDNLNIESYKTLAKIYTTKNELKKASGYLGKVNFLNNEVFKNNKKNFQDNYENKTLVNKTNETFYKWITYTVLLVLSLGLSFLFFFNRFKTNRNKNNELITEQIFTTECNKSDSKSITEEKDLKFELLYNKIIEHFEKDFPYRDENYMISTLAEKLNTNIVYISKAINIYKKMNFKRFVNQYRIDEIKNRLQQNEHKQYTFQSIYKTNGFSNQTTFNRAFKEIEGISPKKYVERLSASKKQN